ncbi:MAG: VCBS repeat-containing protein [Candidatus Hydrogenedentes bacterium]|nr:VCBS repeat-containing protein [Candidatus Hydrogenedentota bacterium]
MSGVSSLFILGGLLFGAEAPHTYLMEPGTEVWDVATHDMNGDGKAEIFVLCCNEKSDPLEKFIAVYFADAEGAYPEKPTKKVSLDPSVGAAFFAKVDGAPPLELVAVNAEGGTIYAFRDGEFVKTDEPRFISLLPSGAKHPIFLKDVAADLDGDEVDEWVVPVPSGYEIRNAAEVIRRVSCDVVSDIRSNDSITITHRLPAHHLMTLENQKSKGLAFLSDETADFWYGDTWSEHKRFKIPFNLDEKWEANAKMEDINGDGLPDLIVSQTKGTINIEAHTQVYLASSAFEYPEKPTASLDAKGAVTSPYLIDVNGDKKADLIIITVPIGLKFFMNYFMMNKLSVAVEVYLFDGAGYGAKPDFKTSLSFDAPEGRQTAAYAMGDFNGDGRIDAAFGAGSDKMEIHTGSATQFLSSKPWVTLSLPPFGVARTCNLVDGKKAKDLILFHPGGDNKTRLHAIVF